MSLDASALRDKITSELGSEVATVSYLKSIKDYIEAESIVTAQYIGMTTTVPPVKDPVLASDVKIVLNPAMPSGAVTKSFLSGLSTPKPGLFLTTLFLEMEPIQFVSVNPVIFTSPVIYTLKVMDPDLDRLAKCDNYLDAWLVFCEHIVDTVKTFQALPASIPSTSVTPGTGITTIISVS